MGKINKTDKVIYQGHLTLVQRPHEGRDYDVIVSKDAAVMLYIDEKDRVYFTKQFRPAMEREMLALPAETLQFTGNSTTYFPFFYCFSLVKFLFSLN